MGESFTDICKILSRSYNQYSCVKDANNSYYNNKELGYLYVSNCLVQSSLHSKELKSVRKRTIQYSLDDTYLLLEGFNNKHKLLPYHNSMKILINNLNLFVEENDEKKAIALLRPQRFDGCLKIGKDNFCISTSLQYIRLGIVNEKYKYCTNNPTIYLGLEMSKLRFKGDIKGDNFVVNYQRDASFVKEEFFSVNVNNSIGSLITWIVFLGICPLSFLAYKINAFLNMKCSSLILYKDIAYVTKFLDTSLLDVGHLVDYLEKLIIECTIDKTTYQLFLYLKFLILCKRVQYNKLPTNYTRKSIHPTFNLKEYKKQRLPMKSIQHKLINTLQKAVTKWSNINGTDCIVLDPLYNYPFQHDTLLSSEDYIRISKNVVKNIQAILVNSGISKDSFISIFYLLQTYKKSNIPLNMFFVQKLFTLFSSFNLLSQIFLMKLGVPPEKICFKSVIRLFGKSLNDLIKANEEVDELYDLYYNNLWVEDRNCSFAYMEKTVNEIHTKRIKHSIVIDDLGVINKSILKCEKVFGIRDLKSVKRLKEKAAMFLDLIGNTNNK